MAQRVGGPWLRLSKLIELFVTMGCEQGELPDQPGGSRLVRYLYSPITDDFVSLLDYEDDEIIPPSEVANWERRLGVIVPKGQTH